MGKAETKYGRRFGVEAVAAPVVAQPGRSMTVIANITHL
jgi:hypothetical protein